MAFSQFLRQLERFLDCFLSLYIQTFFIHWNVLFYRHFKVKSPGPRYPSFLSCWSDKEAPRIKLFWWICSDNESLELVLILYFESQVITPSLSSIVSLSNGNRAKTVQDILNDTIIKALNSTSPTPCSKVKSELLPGPSVKTEPGERHSLIYTSPLPSSFFQIKPVIIKSEIKEEPKDVPVESCVAACMSGHCSGPLVKLNELTSTLNTITGRPFTSLPMISLGPNVSPVDRNSAMEKVIIKSRIGLPFWDEANEVKSL